MNGFNYAECNTNAVITIKKKFKQQTNNADARTSFLLLLADTSAATNNIAECLNSPSEIEKRLSLVKSGDVSFADDLLGLSPKGDNNSRYRAYLALDEGSIIEIRIGNHYETKKVILGKSNNKSQFLFQVVLVPSSPKQVAKDAVTTNTSVGNLKVLTSKIISVESTIEDLKNMLMSIHDYLESPTKSYEEAIQTPINDSKTNKNMKKNVIKLNENTLRRIVAESVKKVLKEEGEGIEAMGSAPSEGYGKYGSLMDKLDEEGDKEIEFILQKNGMLNGRTFTSKSFTSEMVYGFLQQLKSSMIHQLDTRYW